MKPERSIVLDTAVRALLHLVVVFAIFLLFAGHNAPGGGFIAGLVAGAALVLRFISDDPHRRRRDHTRWLGGGLLLAAVTAIAGLVDDGQLLETRILKAELPVLGTLKTTTAFPFDLGVFFVVVGLMIGIINTLGSVDPDETDTAAESPYAAHPVIATATARAHRSVGESPDGETTTAGSSSRNPYTASPSEQSPSQPPDDVS